jgi:hypothetical protein
MEIAVWVASQASSGTAEQWHAALFGNNGGAAWSWCPGRTLDTSSLTLTFPQRINEATFVDRFTGLTGVHTISVSLDGKTVTVTFGSNTISMAAFDRLAQHKFVHTAT